MRAIDDVQCYDELTNSYPPRLWIGIKLTSDSNSPKLEVKGLSRKFSFSLLPFSCKDYKMHTGTQGSI